MRIRLYKKKEDQLLYFQFLSEKGDVYLNSQGYQSKDARSNGIDSVKKNCVLDERYGELEDDGEFFYILKAGNNTEIGRSAGFSSAINSNSSKTEFISEARKSSSDDDYSTNGRSDDYKPLAFYTAETTGKNGFESFDKEGESYFVYNVNGGVQMISEGYTSAKGRDNGIASVEKNMNLSERYSIVQHENGKYYFNLKAGNHQEIATSIWYNGRGAVQSAINKNAGIGGAIGTEGLTGSNRMAEMSIEAAPVVATISSDKPKKKRKKRKKAEPKGERVYLKNGNYHWNDVTYQTMKSTNDKFYFVFRNKEEKAILLNSNVRGFNTEEDVDAAIEKVLKFGPDEGNYTGKTTKNGKFYFHLNDENGKSIGKSFFYNEQDEMKSFAGLFLGEISAVVPAGTSDGSSTKDEKSKKIIDDYLPCPEYAGAEGFHKFEKDGEFYFAFNKNGKTVLRSEGYTSESGRDNGIASVKKNAPVEARWKQGVTDDGKHYTSLRAGNHQEIARSCYSDSVGAMVGSMASFMPQPELKAAMQQPEVVKEKSKKTIDDYLPCPEYAGAEGFHKFEKDGEFYFAFNKNGKTVLRSEGYTSESGRDNGIASVKKNAPIEARWKQGVTDDGKHYTSLRAGNHQEIARGCYSDSVGAMVGFMAAFMPQPELKASMPQPEVVPVVEEVVPEPIIIENGPYLSCEDYAGLNGYHKFFREDVSEYFFAYNKDGKTVLRSEGFKNASDRDTAISIVKKNAKIEDRWVLTKGDDGQYYSLVNNEGSEIAKGCPQKTAGALVGYMGAFMAAPVLVAATLPKKEKVIVAPIVTPVAAVAATSVAAPVAAGGCLKYWWLLLLLLLLLVLLYFNGCFGEKAALVGDTESTTKVEKVVETQPAKSDTKITVATEPEYTEKRINILLPEINYDYDRSNILSEESPELNVVFDKMTKYKDMIVEIGSHTDVRGTALYNKRLAERRAKEARNWLINKGIDGKRLVAKGYGESSPRNKCKEGISCTDDEHRVNRRTEFKIIEGTTFEIIREKKK